jgi:hypothetical protein
VAQAGGAAVGSVGTLPHDVCRMAAEARPEVVHVVTRPMSTTSSSPGEAAAHHVVHYM